ncbi:hypothetical protein Ancab_022021 [Ancistrocladus abbreviatus]
MNGVQLNGKVHSYEKPLAGCLGRMVCLFDLTSNVAGNRLLTDKPHRDGSPLSRSRSDVSRTSSPIHDEIEDKVIVSEFRRSSSGKKSEGTPMKMLIAQEMSKDLESRSNSPNVVAKLMGLDALPQLELPDLASKRSHSKFYSRNSNPEALTGFWQQEHEIFSRNVDYEVPQYHEQGESRDVYETWQQSQKTNCLRDVSPRKGTCYENTNEKKMALIRQKFMELKHLATDEKLHQTKEFQDALEVLNSHRDLFVKFLQEQNSLFSQHLYPEHSIPPSAETKRITVLRPSKPVYDDKFAAAGKKSEKQIKKLTKVGQANGWNNKHHGFSPAIPSWKSDDSPTQPTRIVVLKPNLGKTPDLKAAVSSNPLYPGNFHGGSLFEDPVHDETHEASVAAEEITQQMCKNLAGHRRDETLLSSVFSNGYTGDESSFNKSEAEYVVENLSDSEVMSPASRHSWDYVHRYSTPYSSSSYSRASYSPESSVCREAKKRLSERWAMMASNGTSQEHKHMRRSSSTLGEMLALSGAKTTERSEEEESNRVEGPRGSISCLNSSLGNGESVIESPRSLLRSKSVPISSTAYSGGVSVEVSGPEVCKPGSPKEAVKGKITKSSFKGKVTSLLFPRNKKSSKEKSGKSQFKDGSQSEAAEIPGSPVLPGRTSDDISKCEKNIRSEDALCPSLESPSCSVLPDFDGVSPPQAVLSVSKPAISGISGESQDQPSPISVLEPLFEEDDSSTLGCASSSKAIQYGKQLPLCFSKSNLIDKSPPIGSIARTLSWDEGSAERAASHPLRSPYLPPGTEEGGEWLFLVQSLLSAAGLDNVGQLSSNFAQWHSPESPLDPLLREKYTDLTAKEPLHEAKRRQLRSNRKLVFDCVNTVLVDIVGIGSSISQWARPCVNSSLVVNASPLLVDEVWARMKEWLSGEVRCLLDDDGGDYNSLAEREVRKEVVGKGWAEGMRLEVDNVGKEIEGKLLDELVEESVVEWTCRR